MRKVKNFLGNFFFTVIALILVVAIPLSIYVVNSIESLDSRSRANNIDQSSISTTTSKVLVIIYNPFITETETVVDYYNWNSPLQLTNEIIETFDSLDQDTLKYEIVDEIVYDVFPVKKDDYKYTADTYIECIEDSNKCHKPDEVDYNEILSSTNSCERFNNNEIDEVWIWGGPYFGYWESTLAGPEAFWYNSSPVNNTTCENLLPIMGFNYERKVDLAIHNWGHRIESTMKKVYGTWDQNNIDHTWNKFGLVEHLSQNYNYSGCGNTHYPPNGESDYDYTNEKYTDTFCNDFKSVKIDNVDIQNRQQINCEEWGCDHKGYMKWWMNRIPEKEGLSDEFILNNWWKYIKDPDVVLNNFECRGDSDCTVSDKLFCSENFECVEAQCVKNCDGKCGGPDGCGGTCSGFVSLADLEYDCDLDGHDYRLFIIDWMEFYDFDNILDRSDLNKDGYIDGKDYKLFVDGWADYFDSK